MPHAAHKKTAAVVAHKRLKLRQKQDAEDARWAELEKQSKERKLKEKKEARSENKTAVEKEENVSESTTTSSAPVNSEPASEEKIEVVQKKRERNPNLSYLIGSSKRQKNIKISNVSSVPQNPNIKLNSNAFDVLSSGSGKKKKKGNKRRNND